MKKLTYIFTLISLIVFVSSCEKENQILNDSDLKYSESSEEMFLSTLYAPNYWPEDGFEDQIQLFFDDINNFDNDNSLINETYSLSDGIWNLITAINYTKSSPFCELMHSYEFTVEVEIDIDENDNIINNSLISVFKSLHTNLDSINTEETKLFLIGFKDVVVNNSSIELSLEITKAFLGDFERIERYDPPTGVPDNAVLKMGLPYNGYQSAADEYEKRYNPFLWSSKLDGIQHAYKRYIVQPFSNWSTDLWTNYSNCHYDWPNGDWIPYVICFYQSDMLSAGITGSRFNLYLNRYFQKRIVNYIDNNQIYNIKYLYLRANNYWLDIDGTYGYNEVYPISDIGFILKKGKVTELSANLNTYTY